MTLIKKDQINFQKVYYFLVLAFAFSLPLSRAAISFFTIIFPLIWIIEGNFKQKFSLIQSSKALLLLAAFLGLIFMSILWSSDTKLALKTIRISAYLLTVFVLATSMKQEWSEKVITFFLYGMLISEICAYTIFFDIYPINGRSSDYPSPFMQHIDYSVFLAFASILLLHRLFSSHYTLKEKSLMGLFFLSVTINLFISIGRTGQLAFIVALLVSIIIHFRLSLKALLLFLLLSIGTFFTAYSTVDNFQKRVQAGINDIEKIKKGNLESSWGTRIAYMIVSYDIFLRDPILGVGAGNNSVAVKESFQRKDYGFSKEMQAFMEKFHLHNQYLMILVPYGLVGLILFLSLFYYLLRLDISNRHIKELSILFFTVFLVGFLPEPLLRKQFTVGLFVLFCGIFINASIQTNQHREGED